MIPIDGSTLVNGENQKVSSEVLPEVVTSIKLSELRTVSQVILLRPFCHLIFAMLQLQMDENWKTENFIKVERISVCRGSLPGYPSF